MTERDERFSNPPSLIIEAAMQRDLEERARRDVLEARKGIPTLRSKLSDLMAAHLPKPDWMQKEDQQAEERKGGKHLSVQEMKEALDHIQISSEQLREAMDHAHAVVSDEHKLYSLKFTVPVGNIYSETKKPIEVDVTSLGHPSRSREFTISVEGNPFLLRIKDDNAFVESRERIREPFTMHTPMGPSLDRGPKTSHEMTKEDLRIHDDLLTYLGKFIPTKSNSFFPPSFSH